MDDKEERHPNNPNLHRLWRAGESGNPLGIRKSSITKRMDELETKVNYIVRENTKVKHKLSAQIEDLAKCVKALTVDLYSSRNPKPEAESVQPQPKKALKELTPEDLKSLTDDQLLELARQCGVRP